MKKEIMETIFGSFTTHNLGLLLFKKNQKCIFLNKDVVFKIANSSDFGDIHEIYLTCPISNLRTF